MQGARSVNVPKCEIVAKIGGIARRKSIFDSPGVLVSPREVLFSLPQNQEAAERASVPRHGYGATTDKASRGRALTGPPMIDPLGWI